MYMPPLPKNRFLRGIYLMVQRYLRHDVGIHSAALAFYLLFTIFPFLIFISALLGLLHLDVAEILQALREILPLEIVDFIDVYLTYVGENSSLRLMLFGLFWRRSNRWGALAGMVSGGVMVFIWKFLIAPMGGVWGIYELLPAFVVSSIAIVTVSLATAPPAQEIVQTFDEI